MAMTPGFAEFVVDLLTGLGPVEVKCMFGGGGVYLDGVMFGLIDDDVLYVRTDDVLAAELKAEGSSPWVYATKKDPGGRATTNWSMPVSAMDDPAQAVAIARRALDVAAGIRAAKGGKRTKRT
ncbi:MAG: TfoX/Sxy family protein [Alphaproteobacteria bacterium]|nr:TfoX/Sxy family protein [Alphaproteobacteria bacterium]